MEPFKNIFSAEMVGWLADHLGRHARAFDRIAFEGAILPTLEDLELKERAQLIADAVHDRLPEDHAERARILEAILHPDELDHANQPSDEDGICGWGILPLSMVVGQHGIDDFDRALGLQKEMTKRFSSEFGVRHFLLADQDRALRTMSGWIGDPNRHVRRLISEGTRPRLPWAMQLPRLIEDPSPMLHILEALRDDEEEYVRRSVANHLNDIAKDHPDLIADIARSWMTDADGNREKLIRHACRSLIKSGHREALAAFGLGAPEIGSVDIRIEAPTVDYGGALAFSAELTSTASKPQSLVVDYLVHFRKANGKLAAKVFKGTKLVLEPGETHSYSRSHPIRPITTRKYYPGTQGLSLRINGQDFGYAEFELIMPD